MFRQSTPTQIDMFKDSNQMLSVRSQKLLSSKSAWNVVFKTQFINKINEKPYSVLYNGSQGRPNASISVMLGMMLLKEMNGWSDSQLFDQCRFNIRVRTALGLVHIDQDVPTEATYYDFRAKVAKHNQENNEDLIAQTFSEIVTAQLGDFNIDGSKIRMDSKLIQSNIAKANRLQLIIEAVRKHIDKINLETVRDTLSKQQLQWLETLQVKSTSNLTYNLKSEEKKHMLVEFGYIIHTLYTKDLISKDSILYRIYTEHYQETGTQDNNHDNSDSKQPIEPLPANQIKSDSVQSVHDPDACYRKKGKDQSEQTVQGYHSNITETCSKDNDLNLITSVMTAPANLAESSFLLDAVEQSQEHLGANNPIHETITDGGYDSTTNREEMSKQGKPAWKMHKLKGRERRYQMAFEGEDLKVKDTKNDHKDCKVQWSKRANKYKITSPDNTTIRYMTKAQVEDYITALEITQQATDEDYNLRANVEATIHETFHRLLKRQKTRYRGLVKNHWYVLFRAISVNLGRIERYLAEIPVLFRFFALKIVFGSQIKRMWRKLTPYLDII